MYKELSPIKVLLIDDDKEDIDLLLDLFENRKINIQAESTYNGLEAIENFWFFVVKYPNKIHE